MAVVCERQAFQPLPLMCNILGIFLSSNNAEKEDEGSRDVI